MAEDLTYFFFKQEAIHSYKYIFFDIVFVSTVFLNSLQLIYSVVLCKKVCNTFLSFWQEIMSTLM